MSTYAIGDIQGCYRTLITLLDSLSFSDDDQLWIAGDLVNRGPDSLEVLRFIKSLGPRARIVLGNHDLHLLALASGVDRKVGKTLKPIMQAQDRDELLSWLIQQPLIQRCDALGYVMTHAGIPHIWSLEQAEHLAKEVTDCLNSTLAVHYFEQMYGNKPAKWKDEIIGFDRLRTITNYFTRMRYIKPSGKLDFDANGGLDEQPEGFLPWFELPTQVSSHKQITGHWAALGLRVAPNHYALDTGCVWGGELTALRLEDGSIFSIASQELNR